MSLRQQKRHSQGRSIRASPASRYLNAARIIAHGTGCTNCFSQRHEEPDRSQSHDQHHKPSDYDIRHGGGRAAIEALYCVGARAGH